jgi:hypothetical protein
MMLEMVMEVGAVVVVGAFGDGSEWTKQISLFLYFSLFLAFVGLEIVTIFFGGMGGRPFCFFASSSWKQIPVSRCFFEGHVPLMCFRHCVCVFLLLFL